MSDHFSLVSINRISTSLESGLPCISKYACIVATLSLPKDSSIAAADSAWCYIRPCCPRWRKLTKTKIICNCCVIDSLSGICKLRIHSSTQKWKILALYIFPPSVISTVTLSFKSELSVMAPFSALKSAPFWNLKMPSVSWSDMEVQKWKPLFQSALYR